MGKTTLLFTISVLSAAVAVFAHPQQQESLGDLARQLRAQKQNQPKKATKVFTNDTMPAPAPWEVTAPPAPSGEHPATPEQTSSKPAAPPSSGETNNKQPESPEDKVKTRDYWQGKFKAARQDVAKAKAQQQLAEDELSLLQIQQVRELDPAAKADITAKVEDKQSAVETDKLATDAAQKALDDLEKEFKDSGAPEDWSQTE
jgi:hypothetical protein